MAQFVRKRRHLLSQALVLALLPLAASAQEALRLVDTLRPHLVITDVRMPGMLGTDLASIISHYHPEVIILFFSGFKDFTYAQAAIRSHAFGYLVKPIDIDEVHGTLLRVKAELDTRAAEEPSGATMAVIMLSILPIIIVYLFCQKYIIKGVAAGAVKG